MIEVVVNILIVQNELYTWGSRSSCVGSRNQHTYFILLLALSTHGDVKQAFIIWLEVDEIIDWTRSVSSLINSLIVLLITLVLVTR